MQLTSEIDHGGRAYYRRTANHRQGRSQAERIDPDRYTGDDDHTTPVELQCPVYSAAS